MRLIIGTNYIMSDVALSMSLEVRWVEKRKRERKRGVAVATKARPWLLRPDHAFLYINYGSAADVS